MIYNFDGPGLQCFKVSYKEVMRGYKNVLIQSNLFEKKLHLPCEIWVLEYCNQVFQAFDIELKVLDLISLEVMSSSLKIWRQNKESLHHYRMRVDKL